MLLYEIGYGIIIEFIINILRIVLLKQAVEIFLKKKDKDAKIFKLAYGACYLATSAAYCVWQLSFLYEVCNFIGMIGIVCCYNDAWKKKLWTIVTVYCIDFACLSAMFFSFDQNMSGINLYLKTAASVLLFLISVTAVRHISGSDDYQHMVFEWKQTFLLMITPIASIIVLLSLLYGKTAHDKMVVVICICMLAINLSIFYLYHEMLRSYMHLRERDIYKQQTELYQNQMEVIMESQGRIRSLRHDMKNHILALQAAAENGSREEMQEYLTKMQEFMINPAEYAATGNETIDSVLNYKIRRAKESLNVVETKISVPEKLSLSSFDLNVILGNLLDNAIEAAIQTEEKRLEIRMSVEKGVLFLTVGNSYYEKSLGKRGVFKTTKADKDNHGIGMKNVQAIVEKYHGDMEIACDDGYFEVEIMLYMKGL